ncbi:heavy metal-associated isoprenylated plant protein 39-like [Papaver somniferum]|nr:heavy metal-associated isoprenylated plant protein 39-like [Papaver somniferum]
MAEKKVVLKLLTMTDERTKQKAMEAVADIYGVDSIAADLKEQKLTVIGEMDTIAIAKKLKKIGKIDIISVGPAKEPEKKPEEKKPDPPAAAAAAAAPAKKPEEKK